MECGRRRGQDICVNFIVRGRRDVTECTESTESQLSLAPQPFLQPSSAQASQPQDYGQELRSSTWKVEREVGPVESKALS